MKLGDTSRSDLEESLKAALQEEIAHLDRSGGERTIAAVGGTLLRQAGDWFVYSFLLDREFQVPDDSSALATIGSEPERAIIISVRGMELILGLARSHGPTLSRVEVSVDPSALMKRILERFEDQTLPNRKDSLARMAFGYASPRTGSLSFQSKMQLSDEKRRAVEQTLGSAIQFIWGPPGTGKTQTIAALCELLVEAGESVLLASHTNIAVDEALLRTAGPGGPLNSSPLYAEGKLIRVGPPRHPELAKIEELQAEAVANRLAKDLKERVQAIEARTRELQNRRDEVWQVLQHWADIRRATAKTRSATQAWKDNLSAVTSIEAELAQARHREAEALNRLDRALGATGLRRLIQRNPAKYQQVLVAAEHERGEVETALDWARSEEVSSRALLASANQELDRLRSTAIESEADAKSEIALIDEELRSLDSELSQLKERIAGLLEQVIHEARFIGSTMTKAAIDETLSKRAFDAVIVDEASMAPLPLLYLLCLRAAKRVVIVGDFHQLPPIVQSGDELAQQWLGRDIFQQAGLASNELEPKLRPVRADLHEQHRMAPEIRRFVSEHFYGALLRDGYVGPRPRDEFWAQQEPRGPSVCVVDTSSLEAWSQRSPGIRPSKFNLYSALVAVELAESLLTNVDQLDELVDRPPVGIITPYRAQASLLRVLLDERNLARRVSVGTVHSFQGLENDVVIFDFVEDQPNWKAGPLLLDQGPRLINVAVTRARHRLIVLGSYRHARKHLKNSVLWDLVQYASSQSTISAESFLRQDFLRAVAEASSAIRHGEIDEASTHLRVCTERDFFAALEADLRKAKRRIVLFAPFLGRRLEDVVPRLRERIEADVDVYVVTPPLADIDESAMGWYKTAHQRLQSLGVRLVPFRKMHQKLVFIDSDVVYVGGLNPLSHVDTAEIMDRWHSKEVAKAHADQVRLADLLSMWTDPADPAMRTCPRDGYPLTVVAPVTWQDFDPMFWGCSRHPECDYKRRFSHGPRRSGSRLCDRCGSPMRLRRPATQVWWVCIDPACGARRKVQEGEVTEERLRDLPPPPRKSSPKARTRTRRSTYSARRRGRRRR
jgi:ssDNA-binding Zn-finger/Zn-ribbon topoisomerase 1